MRTWRDVLREYGGEIGFYKAVEDGVIVPDSDDYERFYVATRHARVLLQQVRELLRARGLSSEAIGDRLTLISDLLSRGVKSLSV